MGEWERMGRVNGRIEVPPKNNLLKASIRDLKAIISVLFFNGSFLSRDSYKTLIYFY